MPLSVSYMGTKRQLASSVGAVVDRCQPGIFLDVFSGMCAVASSVAPKRQIWTNDFQYFAQSVSFAHFCSQTGPLARLDAVAIVSAAYSKHVGANLALASARLGQEEAALTDLDFDQLNRVYAGWAAAEPLQIWEDDSGRSAHLFRDTFAGAYFGLSQVIEIDALRYAIDKAKRTRRINSDQHRWLLLAVCVSLSKCSNSTGHFAQPLTAKSNNIVRFARQRRASIWENWITALGEMSPIGSKTWRKKNRAIRGDALTCLSDLCTNRDFVPTVIYADPPYTNDQYSRYYHLYDTFIRYDYPKASGRGLYRPDRAVSSFSLASAVGDSMRRLIVSSAELGADLVLSYPANGLLRAAREVIPQLVQSAYGRAPEILEIKHEHSTMGASKGRGKQPVTEIIYRAFH